MMIITMMKNKEIYRTKEEIQKDIYECNRIIGELWEDLEYWQNNSDEDSNYCNGIIGEIWEDLNYYNECINKYNKELNSIID